MKNLLYTNTLFLLMITLSSGCSEERTLTSKSLVTNVNSPAQTIKNSTTAPIDVERSIINWRGTKLGGIRGHEGTLEFERGDLLFRNESIVGGFFVVSMKSLEVTDIPDDQATAKNKLKKHLKSEFKTKAYPQSTFEITEIEYPEPKQLQVWGNLTMRGVTKKIPVFLKIQKVNEFEKVMTATIDLDRSAWNIGEDGSWLEKRVVDNKFTLNIQIAY